MSTLLRFPSPNEQIAGYRFGRVELLIDVERVVVDGADVAVSPMVFRLLLGLCRAGETLLTRNAAFDLLWPGGGSASDEALAQIVRKLRLALGADGRYIITLRSRGFRLAAPIETFSVPRAAPRPANNAIDARAPSPRVAEPVAVSAAPTRRPWRAWWIVAAIAVVCIVGLMIALRPIDIALSGFALNARDFGEISNAGIRTLGDALDREGENDRATATHLLETLLDKEPRSAAAPFLLLYWQGGGTRAHALSTWRRLFEERLPPTASSYLRLFGRWISEDDAALGSKLEWLTAMLKLEPSAWRVRLARAHVALELARYDQALADLRAIPLRATDPRVRMVIMGDLASLGEAEAMEREVPALAAQSLAAADYVRGRIAMARGQWLLAQQAFEAVGADTEHDVLIGSLDRAWLLAAVAAAQRDDWAHAQALTQIPLRIGTEHDLPELIADAQAIAGYTQHRLGHADARDALWNRLAGSLTDDSELRRRLWLVRARIDPAWSDAHFVATDTHTDASLAALVQARRAWIGCRADLAARHLTDAEQAGVDSTYAADEADLLRQDLGMPRHAPPAPPQLPYPLVVRWITYFAASQPPAPRPCERGP